MFTNFNRCIEILWYFSWHAKYWIILLHLHILLIFLSQPFLQLLMPHSWFVFFMFMFGPILLLELVFFFYMIQVRGWKLYFFQFHMVVLAYFSENKLYFFISLLWYLHQQSNANIYVHLYGAQLYLMIYSFILNIVAYCSDCWSFMENL